jgi:hypothetical protein
MSATMEPPTIQTGKPAPWPTFENVKVNHFGGGRSVVVELDNTGGLTCRLSFGALPEISPEERRRFAINIETEAAPLIEQIRADFDAETEALPSAVEVRRLEAVAEGYTSKIGELDAAISNLNQKIVGDAKQAVIDKKDRRRLAELHDDLDAHKDVLKLAKAQLDDARAKHTTDRKVLARAYRDAAEQRWKTREDAVRDDILRMEQLWAVLRGSQVEAAISNGLHPHFDAIAR